MKQNKNPGIEEMLKKYIVSLTPIKSEKERKALFKSMDKLHLMGETKRSIIWISKPDFEEIFYVSPAYEKIWGRSRKSLYNSPKTFVENVDPDDRGKSILPHGSCCKKGKKVLEYTIVHSDGSLRWIKARCFPVIDDEGNHTLIVGEAFDITELKEEKRIEKERLKRINNQQKALILMVNRISSRCEGFDETIKYITTLTAKTLKVKRTGVWIFSEDKQLLHCRHLVDKSDGEKRGRKKSRLVHSPIYVKTLETNHAVAVEDVLTDKRTSDFNEDYFVPFGIMSILDVPIQYSGKMVGVLCNEEVGEKRKWNVDEVRFATEVAHLLAQAFLETHRREDEKIYQTMLQTAKDAIIMMDEQGKITDFNISAENIFGYSSAEAKGKKMEILLASQHRPAHNQSLKNDLSTFSSSSDENVCEYDAVRKNGTEFAISMTISSAKLENKRMFMAIVRDLTESNEAELSLKKLSTAIEQSVNIVFMTNIDGVLEYVNETFVKVTGYSREEAIGMNPSFLASGETPKRQYEELWRAILAGKTWRGNYKNRKKSGDLFWCNTVISPITDTKGKITNFLAVIEDVTDKIRADEKIANLANFDEVTGLINRSRFMELFREKLFSVAKEDFRGALFLIDIDRFKLFNDTQGHGCGDNFLRQMATLLNQTVSGLFEKYGKGRALSPGLGRLGSDEFAAFLPFVTEKESIEIAKNMRRDVKNLQITEKSGSLTICVSIALFPEHGKEMKTLLTKGDAAMYRAKKLGGDRHHLYRPEDKDLEKIHSNLQQKERILKSLREDRFIPWFQPILNIKDNKVRHYEALARMYDEEGKILFPNAFIDVAEKFSLIGEIDRAIIGKTIHLQAEMRKKGENISFSMNLSGKDIGDEELLSFLEYNISEKNADPEFLIFEITETAAIQNMEKAIKFVNTLKSMGCHFSLDDFGVGFTSFSYLKELQVDYIKIDGSFIQRLINSHEDQVFVKAMTDVAKGLGIKSVAEFIENEETLKMIGTLGIDFAQGYLIGKPSPNLIDYA